AADGVGPEEAGLRVRGGRAQGQRGPRECGQGRGTDCVRHSVGSLSGTNVSCPSPQSNRSGAVGQWFFGVWRGGGAVLTPFRAGYGSSFASFSPHEASLRVTVAIWAESSARTWSVTRLRNSS